MDVTPHFSVLVCEWLYICIFNESELINEKSVLLLSLSKRECQNISLYEPEQSLSHSVRMRENSAEVYPKQSSLERSF